MKLTDTISVNPGKTALGHVNEEARNLLRANVLKGDVQKERLDLLSFFFPTTSSGLFSVKKYALPLRTLFATILIVGSILMLESNPYAYSAGYAIALMTAGGMLAIGFLTRPVMALTTVFLAIWGALSIRWGRPDMNSFSLMFGSAIFALTGSGKYSCDEALFKVIRKYRKEKEARRKSEGLSYKAFQMATKSL